MTIKGGSGQQLRMFMTARELVEDTTSGEVTGYDSPAALWHEKRLDNDTPMWGADEQQTMNESVRGEGVSRPVTIMLDRRGDELWDGHHRTIAAYDHNPDTLVPVEYEMSRAEEERYRRGRK